MNFPEKLTEKLQKRVQNNALRQLGCNSPLIDFASNDYLGFARSEKIFDEVHHFLIASEFIVILIVWKAVHRCA